jgi:iron complex outermembrane receptor protein
MNKSAFLLVFLLLTGLGYLEAQELQVKGKVTASEDGTPVPGAYIVIKGTQSGTTTDGDGNYAITAPADATLVFSSVGLKTREIVVGSSSVIDVVLEPDIIGMQEVIVVGYTSVRKEANTGAVNVVKSERLRDVPEVSFDKMLSGKIPGVSIAEIEKIFSGSLAVFTWAMVARTRSIRSFRSPGLEKHSCPRFL